ncbi:unnamed protein product [Closterium sp. NIES-54]
MKQSRRKGSRGGSLNASLHSSVGSSCQKFLETKIPDVATSCQKLLETKIPDVASDSNERNLCESFFVDKPAPVPTKQVGFSSLHTTATEAAWDVDRKYTSDLLPSSFESLLGANNPVASPPYFPERGSSSSPFLDGDVRSRHPVLEARCLDAALKIDESDLSTFKESVSVAFPVMKTSSPIEGCDHGHSLFTSPTDGVRKMEGSFSNFLSSSSELFSGAEKSGSPPPYIPSKVNEIFSPHTEKVGSGQACIPQQCGSEPDFTTVCKNSSVLNEWEAPPSSSPQKNTIEELFSDLPAKPLGCGGCVNADLGARKSVSCGEWRSLNSTSPLVVSMLFFDDERRQLYVSLDLQLPSKKRDWAANGVYLSSIEDLSILGVVVHQIGQPKLRVILLPGVNVDVLPTSNATHEEFREAIRAAIVSADAIICCDSQRFIRSLLQWNVPVMDLYDMFIDPKARIDHLRCVHTSLNLCNDVHAALVARANGPLRDAFRVNMRLLPVLAQMEIAGVRVDMDLLMSKRDYLEKRMEHLTSIGENFVGRRINLASPKQVSQALYEDLKLPVGAAKSVGMAKKREAQTHSTTNEATLSQLASFHQFPSIVLEATYEGQVDSFESLLTYLLMRPCEIGLCPCLVQVNVFKAGQRSDVFRLIGAAYLGKTADEVNDQERQLVKRLCYGILYGQGKQAMASILGPGRMDMSQPCGGTAGYFQMYTSGIQRGGLKQKGRQDLMKLAMLDASKLVQGNNNIQIVMQVHDELVLEVPEEDVFKVYKAVKQMMEKVACLDVPLVVNVRAGSRFGSLRAIEE